MAVSYELMGREDAARSMRAAATVWRATAAEAEGVKESDSGKQKSR